MRKRIYVAGPISQGDTARNIRRGIEMGLDLLERGYAVYIPHFSHTVDPGAVIGTRRYEIWLENDLAWISVCDAVLRLPGDSAGANREVFYAQTREIPVFFTVQELEDFFHADV